MRASFSCREKLEPGGSLSSQAWPTRAPARRSRTKAARTLSRRRSGMAAASRKSFISLQRGVSTLAQSSSRITSAPKRCNARSGPRTVPASSRASKRPSEQHMSAGAANASLRSTSEYRISLGSASTPRALAADSIQSPSRRGSSAIPVGGIGNSMDLGRKPLRSARASSASANRFAGHAITRTLPVCAGALSAPSQCCRYPGTNAARRRATIR